MLDTCKKWTLEEARKDAGTDKKVRRCANCKFSKFSSSMITDIKCEVYYEDIYPFIERRKAKGCKYYQGKD